MTGGNSRANLARSLYLRRRMQRDFSKELRFQTARSGGKGGQHVNKVETMVEAYFQVDLSGLLTDEEKALVKQKLSNKINAEGFLIMKSQSERTQLGNKEQVIKKMNDTISKALIQPKKRKPSQPTHASKRKRIEEKKNRSDIKENRKKFKL